MSWATRSMPSRTASRTVAIASQTAAMSDRRQPRAELAALLGQLRAGERRGERADHGDQVAFGEAGDGAADGSGISPTMPTTGVG